MQKWPPASSAAGRSSRLYKALVYEKQIAQTVIGVSEFADPRVDVPDRGDGAARATPPRNSNAPSTRSSQRFAREAPSSREIEQARNTIETAIIGGLERLGGFGGIADRLNMYNHYLRTPDYLDKDIQRYRAVTPATLLAFARDQLTTSTRVVVHATPGQPKPVAQSSGASTGRKRAEARPRPDSRSMRTSRGASRFPKPGPTKPLQLAAPASAVLAEWAHAHTQRTSRIADRRRESRDQDRQRCEPDRETGPGKLRGGDAR